MDAPTDEERAAIAAAYAVLLRNASPEPPPQPGRWRRAGRADAALPERRSTWRAAGRVS
jgi:hypothetical protein